MIIYTTFKIKKCSVFGGNKKGVQRQKCLMLFFFLSLFHIFTPKVKRKHRFKDRSTTSKGKSLKSYTRQLNNAG